MAESTVGVDLDTGVGRLIGHAIMLVVVMSEMRGLRRFVLVLAIARSGRKSGVQRQQQQQKDGEKAFHGRLSIAVAGVAGLQSPNALGELAADVEKFI